MAQWLIVKKTLIDKARAKHNFVLLLLWEVSCTSPKQTANLFTEAISHRKQNLCFRRTDEWVCVNGRLQEDCAQQGLLVLYIDLKTNY